MDYRRLDNDQARQQIDAQQLFTVLRDARAGLSSEFAGSMRWRTIAGHEYLVKKIEGKEVSLGRRSRETEATHKAFADGRARLRTRVRTTSERLSKMDRVNVAYGLGRVPDLPARIMASLDRAGLMGASVVVIGATALFAYEAMAGVHFETGIVATKDFDLLIETKAGLQLAAGKNRREAVMAALVAADRSFEPRYGEYAVNDAGFEVDFLEEDDKAPPLSGKAAQAVAIGQSGRPVRMVVPMPAAFIKHKAWLAKQPSRNPAKRGRDAAQAVAIKEALAGYVPTPITG